MMNHRTMSMVFGLVGAATIAGLAPSVAMADAPPRCFGITGGGTTHFDGAGFAGTVELRVGGQVQQVDVSTALTPDGGTTHVFEFDQGDITTDDVLLSPIAFQPGEQQLWTALTVVDGGRGGLRLLPTGTIDIFGGSATWQVRGQVCFDPPSGE